MFDRAPMEASRQQPRRRFRSLTPTPDVQRLRRGTLASIVRAAGIGEQILRAPRKRASRCGRERCIWRFSRARKARQFLIKYQDRILYGTDLAFFVGQDAAAAEKKWAEQYATDWALFSSDKTVTHRGKEVQGLWASAGGASEALPGQRSALSPWSCAVGKCDIRTGWSSVTLRSREGGSFGIARGSRKRRDITTDLGTIAPGSFPVWSAAGNWTIANDFSVFILVTASTRVVLA
jgi:hypothetical protein